MNKKTHSTVEIPPLQDLGTGRWYFHFDFKKSESKDKTRKEKGKQDNECETVVIYGKPTYDKIAKAVEDAGYKLTKKIIEQIKDAL